jgi:hypothetical protein
MATEMTTTSETGFYATDNETFYRTPAGRAWIVSSPDFDGIREIGQIPSEAISANQFLTPEESIDYCRQIEAESGESLIEQD